jgi:hypothetical protein
MPKNQAPQLHKMINTVVIILITTPSVALTIVERGVVSERKGGHYWAATPAIEMR